MRLEPSLSSKTGLEDATNTLILSRKGNHGEGEDSAGAGAGAGAGTSAGADIGLSNSAKHTVSFKSRRKDDS